MVPMPSSLSSSMRMEWGMRPSRMTVLRTPERIGLTVTDSMLLLPIKSVTAVIGVSRTPQECVPEGCVSCGKKDCLFRR